MKRLYFLEPFSDELLLQSPREQAIRAYLRSKNVAELLSKMYFPDMDDKQKAKLIRVCSRAHSAGGDEDDDEDDDDNDDNDDGDDDDDEEGNSGIHAFFYYTEVQLQLPRNPPQLTSFDSDSLVEIHQQSNQILPSWIPLN